MTFIMGQVRRCPACKEDVYDMKLKICTSCGAELPRTDL